MATKYPAQIDNTLTLPNVVDSLTPVQAKQVNLLRDAIISIQSELGVKPAGVYSTVKNRITTLETTLNSLNSITISGDLGGTSSSILVDGIQGRPVAATAPTNGQALVWNGTNWSPGNVATTTPDASTSVKGIIQLAGNLAGTATSPIVTGIRAVTVGAVAPVNGQVLTATSESTAAWSTPGAGAGDATTLAKGIVQLAGDLGGTAAIPKVLGLNGASGITAAGALPIGSVLKVTGNSTIDYGAVNLTLANAVTGILPAANHPDAATGAKGIIQLTTDLGGTSTAPTVIALTGASGTLPIKCAEVTNSSVTNMIVKDKNFYVQTTNATVTAIATLATTSNTAFQVDAIIVAKKSDHAQAAVYKRSVLIRNVAGVITMVGSVDGTDTKEDASTWDATLAISGTNIVCNVTGVAATTINWVSRISTIQVA